MLVNFISAESESESESEILHKGGSGHTVNLSSKKINKLILKVDFNKLVNRREKIESEQKRKKNQRSDRLS